MSLRLSGWLALAAALAACGGDEPGAVVRSSEGPAPPECRSRAEGSRWADAGGGYVQSGVHGKDPNEFLGEVAGVAEIGGQVYVLDPVRARVSVLDADLRPVREIGRPGQGPGELDSRRAMGIRGATWSWMEPLGDTLAVFDGFRLQLFAADGTLLESRLQGAAREGKLAPSIDRLRIAGEALVSPTGGYQLGRPRGPHEWTLRRSTERESTPIVSLRLANPPTTRGVPFIGPEQARPAWDAAGGCVLAGDGTGRFVVRAGLGGGAVDTLALDLPEVERPKINVAEMERSLKSTSKGQGGGYAEPTALAELGAITIDPDGYAWLLPVQDSAVAGEGVVVVRLSLQTGAAVTDTVPGFPIAFGEPGVFYARQGPRGDRYLARYRLQAAGQ